jgi:hypothetical protein
MKGIQVVLRTATPLLSDTVVVHTNPRNVHQEQSLMPLWTLGTVDNNAFTDYYKYNKHSVREF